MFILVLAVAAAQPDAVDSGSDGVVISASRDQDQKVAQTPRDVAMTDRAEMAKRGVDGLTQAAASSPGAHVQETNPGASLVMLRGLVGPEVLIVVDGLRYNTSTFRTGPNQYLGLLGSFALERVEVMQGPSSVLYGNGAMGGVVHLVTKRFDPSAKPSAFKLGYSVHGSHAGNGAVVHQIGSRKQHLILALQRREVLARHRGGLLDGDTLVPLADVQQSDVLVKAGWTQGSLRLTAGYLGLLTRGGGRLDRIEQGDARRYSNQDHFGWLRLLKRSPGLLRRTTAFVGLRQLQESVRRDRCLADDGAVLDKEACIDGLDRDIDPVATTHLKERRLYEDGVVMAQAGLQTALRPLGSVKLTFGLEWAEEWIDSSETRRGVADAWEEKARSRGNFVPASRYRTGGIYGHARWRLMDGDRKLDWNSGLRWALFGAEAPASAGLESPVNYQQSGPVVETQLILHGKGQVSYWLGLSQGFRAPNLQESTVLGDTGSKFEVPNPDLGAQRSNTVELGLRQYRPKLRFSAVAFFTAMRDLIDEESTTYQGQTEIDSAPVVQRVNRRSGEYYGLHGSIETRSGWWREAHRASWIAGAIERSDGWVTPRRLPPLQGQHQWGVALSKTLELAAGLRWAWTQNQLHPSDRKDLRICAQPGAPHLVYSGTDCPGTPAWYRVDSALLYRPTKQTLWRLALENLTDRPIKSHGSGTPAPGITGRLSLQQQF